jgi:hypothetical protein
MVRAFRFSVACVVVVLAAATASAQFGHPLKGSWSGDWMSGASRTHVVLDIDWDGKMLTTRLNPGPNAVALKTTLEPSTWAVHFDGDGKDTSGANVHYVVDGKIENLGAARRMMTGTWQQGSQKGTFKLTRN